MSWPNACARSCGNVSIKRPRITAWGTVPDWPNTSTSIEDGSRAIPIPLRASSAPMPASIGRWRSATTTASNWRTSGRPFRCGNNPQRWHWHVRLRHCLNPTKPGCGSACDCFGSCLAIRKQGLKDLRLALTGEFKKPLANDDHANAEDRTADRLKFFRLFFRRRLIEHGSPTTGKQ